jgi:NADH-quinone oxidoreductase subunit A
MTLDFAAVIVFFGVGFLFLLALFTFSALVRPRSPGEIKSQPYECGIPPVGPPWIQFNIRFYTIALIFLVFDVEIALLYPCAVLVKDFPGPVLIDMLAFVGMLAVGLAYLWVKGDLEWVKASHATAPPAGTAPAKPAPPAG